MPKQPTSTILKVYLLDKSRPGKEEGMINLCNENGSVTQISVHFDSLDDMPTKIRELLKQANVIWPR